MEPKGGEASRPPPSSTGSEGRGRFTRLSLTLDTPYRRPIILAAIIPKVPMTIGLPIALTNQGCERTCSFMTSGCCRWLVRLDTLLADVALLPQPEQAGLVLLADSSCAGRQQ
jgi:hypothetical protein